MTTNVLKKLRPFFYPESIAIVGVSADPSKPGNCLLRANQKFGYKGKIYPVGQRLSEINGLPVFQSISSIPDRIDMVRICVPAAVVPGVVKECRDKGVPAVEIITSGFKEASTDAGKQLEASIAAMAGPEMSIIGPNCFGVYCPDGGITQIPGLSYPRQSGAVGFISQSGSISEDICRSLGDYGFRMSKVISYGNASDIDETDLLQYMETDPATRIVGIYIEGAKRGREFFEVLKRITTSKPVIIWKGGQSQEGARAASSHTASIAGDERAWDALFRQTSAIKVSGLEEMLDTIDAFYTLKPLTDNRISVICSGGGNCVSSTDISFSNGLSIPRFKDEIKQKIASVLPPVGTSAANPVDVGPPFFPPAEQLLTIMEAIASSNEYGSIIIDKLVISAKMREILDYKDQMGWIDQPWLEEVPVKIARKYNIALIIVLRHSSEESIWADAEAERHRLSRYYHQNGIPVYPTAERALKSLGKVVPYYRGNK